MRRHITRRNLVAIAGLLWMVLFAAGILVNRWFPGLDMNAIALWFAVGGTAIAASIAYLDLQHARDAEDNRLRPFLSTGTMSIKPDGIVWVPIKNHGGGLARDVRWEVEVLRGHLRIDADRYVFDPRRYDERVKRTLDYTGFGASTFLARGQGKLNGLGAGAEVTDRAFLIPRRARRHACHSLLALLV